MKLTDFRRNKAHVQALSDFLSTPAGLALQIAVRSETPARKLGENSATLNAQNLRGKAAFESDSPGRSENLLGTIEGFESALCMIFDLATDFQVKIPPQSRKGGARSEIQPEPTPPN